MRHANSATLSVRLYFLLIAALTVAAAISVFLPQGLPVADAQLPATGPVMALTAAAIYLIVYGGLGFIGLKLARKLGIADLCDPAVSRQQRFLIPALVGVGLGVFFILIDQTLAPWHELGPLPHPPFPTSIVASIAAGIGEEIIFRLFFITFWVWLVSHLLLKGRWQTQIFWIIAVVSALAFAFGHLPAVMFLLDVESIQAIPPLLMIEIVILNGTLSLFAAHYFKLYGFLAAVSIHFWADVIWHIIWGLFS